MHHRSLSTALALSLLCNVFLGVLLVRSMHLFPATSILPSAASQSPASSSATVSLVRVVDGDTLLVRSGEKEEYVRFIGIDAPEEHKNGQNPPDCFAKEASAFLRSTLGGAGQVRLVFDESQGRRDVYGRVLAYPFFGEQDLGALLLREGYVREFTFKVPYAKQVEYKEAERDARKEWKGLWDRCVK